MQLIISISDAQPGISWNKGKYFIYNRHKGKKLDDFSSRYSKSCILNEKLNPQVITTRTYFSKIRGLCFLIFWPSPLSPLLVESLKFYLIWYIVVICLSITTFTLHLLLLTFRLRINPLPTYFFSKKFPTPWFINFLVFSEEDNIFFTRFKALKLFIMCKESFNFRIYVIVCFQCCIYCFKKFSGSCFI